MVTKEDLGRKNKIKPIENLNKQIRSKEEGYF